MTGMSKKSLQIVVFGTLIILSIIIFYVLMNNMSVSKESNNKYQNDNSEIDQKNEDKNVKPKNKGDFYYEFERVNIKDICPIDASSCENVIGTLKVEEKTKILALKYSNSEYVIKIDDNVFYKETNNLNISEFINYENKYLIIIFNKNDVQNKLILLDKEGNKILEDKNLKSEVVVSNGKINYKTLNCPKDNYIYAASIKIIDNKPKVILNERTNEKSNEC